jgi:hypothetical protein
MIDSCAQYSRSRRHHHRRLCPSRAKRKERGYNFSLLISRKQRANNGNQRYDEDYWQYRNNSPIEIMPGARNEIGIRTSYEPTVQRYDDINYNR